MASSTRGSIGVVACRRGGGMSDSGLWEEGKADLSIEVDWV